MERGLREEGAIGELRPGRIYYELPQKKWTAS